MKTKDLTDIGILENAYKISYEKHFNELWSASYCLPIDDPKKDLCQPFNVVEIIEDETNEYIGLFRIIPEETKLENNEITFQLEHVLATLMDSVLFKYHQPGINITTADNIQYILERQNVQHWKKGTIAFQRYFQYSFENENGLLAPILSIPKPFNLPYEWTYDTVNYPWTLNLVEPTQVVTSELRWGKNMGSFEEHIDPTEIVNRIYPLGAGEGVNQLDITRVNNGVPYLEDAESIAKYGLREYIWIDKRFEVAESLKASGQSLLDQWKEPKISLTAKGADLSAKKGFEHEKSRLGDLIDIVVPDNLGGEKVYTVRIVSEAKKDLTGKYEDIEFELNNKLDDIATTQADQERKQQVNDAYSMGATNILSFNYQDNCDSNIPALIPFYVDDDVVNVNTSELTFRTKKFRAYSQTTKGGGATVKSTSSGGGTTATSSSGGGTSKSTESGGSTTQTAAANGDHSHLIFKEITNFQGPFMSVVYQGQAGGGYLQIEGSGGDIYSAGSSGNHTHGITFPAHSHSFSTPNHTHDVTISPHTHDIDLPDHTHDVEHKIVELDETPTSVVIKVDGNLVPHTDTSGDRINLVEYMSKDASGKIQRGRHEITISPNGLARIEADLILRVFIRSQLGGQF